MEEILIQTAAQKSRILLGEKLQNLKNYIPAGKKTILITDHNLNRIYGKDFASWPVIEIGTGEENKNMATIDAIIARLVELEADRTCYIVGIGGGIVCDITGFAASIFMRGVRFGFVSTTLLSQVDASVGGKNGVNYTGYKNMIGVFNQPDFVICDFEMLRSLDRKEFIGGMAEIIKHGAIKNKQYFEDIEKLLPAALEHNTEAIHKLVRESVVIKAGVVEEDEREAGERKKLNFGHTVAHAIEKIDPSVIHGEAVAIGMVVAARLSVKKGLLKPDDSARLEKLISRSGLPVRLTVDKNLLFNAMRKDKKRDNESINFILLKGLGSAVIEKISIHELEEQLNDLC